MPQQGPGRGKSWNDAPTPRTERGRIEDGSLRVPNRGWDETPRDGRSRAGPSNGRTMNRSWDTATPRANRDPSPDDGQEVQVDVREWEEEQVRLDRDWYSTYDEGNVAGDEDHNPFAGFEGFGAEKEKEMEAKAVKKITARQAQYVGDSGDWRRCEMTADSSEIRTERGQRCMGDQSNAHLRSRTTSSSRLGL